MSPLDYFLKLISGSSQILSYRPRHFESFVSESPIHLEPMKLTGIIGQIAALGIRAKTRILSFEFVHPPKKVTVNLKLSEGARVLRIERIRSIKGQPISCVTSYIPSDLGERIRAEDLAVKPLLEVLEDKCKVRIVRGSQIIEATMADVRVASFLDVMIGSPLLRIERVVFDRRDRPLEYVSILYRSDRYHYVVDLIKKRPELENRRDDMRQ